MQGYNVIIVFNKDEDRLLMCRRKKDPFKGLKNLVGGKIESGENGLDAAYRELLEETGIGRNDIILNHLMDFTYYLSNCYVEVYVGRLNRDAAVYGDENELFWSDLNVNFFDVNEYAGGGNIGHMLEQVKSKRDQIFSKNE